MTHTIKLEASDASRRCWVNGAQVMQPADVANGPTAGTLGTVAIGCRNGGGAFPRQFDAIRAFRREGLVRHVGLSEVSVEDIRDAQHYVQVVTVQGSASVAISRKAVTVLRGKGP